MIYGVETYRAGQDVPQDWYDIKMFNDLDKLCYYQDFSMKFVQDCHVIHAHGIHFISPIKRACMDVIAIRGMIPGNIALNIRTSKAPIDGALVEYYQYLIQEAPVSEELIH